MRYRCAPGALRAPFPAPAPKVHRACIQFQICVRCYISGLIFVCLKRLHMCVGLFLSRVFPCLCLFLDVTLRGQLLCLCVCFCRVRVVDLVCLCLHSPACVFPLLSLYIYIYIYMFCFYFVYTGFCFVAYVYIVMVRFITYPYFENQVLYKQWVHYKTNTIHLLQTQQ